MRKLKTISQINVNILTTVLLLSGTSQSYALGMKCSDLYSSSSFVGKALLFQNVEIHTRASAALRDPLVDKARQLKVYDDFKYLSDLTAKPVSPQQRRELEIKAQKIEQEQGAKKATQFLIESLYEHKNELLPVSHPDLNPNWTLSQTIHRATFDHIESMWSVLVRRTPPKTESSLIPLPHPLMIPGARFQEGYYWDTFFAFPTLLKTGRESLVRGQIENFLFLLKNYGLIPNGTRDYYLSRSQPPLLSQMVRIYIEHEMQRGPLSRETQAWIRDEVLPLVKKDYEKFWMNPKTRLDAATGLNHHFDSQNTPRPERHSSDNEEAIAKTYKDVRAEAESGKDFTDAYEGEASQYASVMLNSILYQVERDISWMSTLTGSSEKSRAFEIAAEARKAAINKYMWDSKTGTYRDYHLIRKTQSPVVTADSFLPLFVQLATPAQAQKVTAHLANLERDGGLMSSEKDSGKQWDAPYGWAPHHYFAISGLQKYGFQNEAQRLAFKWVRTVDNIYQETGKIIEKIDAVRGGVPVETGDKYPTQDGFLWTNGVYAWALTDVLKIQPVRIPRK
jgi:alpha,alpha-trehalase